MQRVSGAWITAQTQRLVPESFIQIEVAMQRSEAPKVFRKSDILSYEHSMEADLLSGSIASNKITFSLDNTRREWDATNPTNYARFLAQASKVTVKYGLDTGGDEPEWISGGVFYLSDWTTPSNGLEAAFTAGDVFAYMTESYTGSKSGTLYSIALAALTQDKLPNGDPVLYVLDRSLRDITGDFSQDTTDYTRAQVLQLVSNAACCVMFVDREGVIHIEPLSIRMTDYVIDRARSYQYPEYSLSQGIKDVEVDHSYGKVKVVGSGYGNTQTVKNPLVSTQSQALRVGRWASNTLVGRKTMKSTFRADPRADVLDRVTVEHQYGQDSVVILTALKLRYTGAWKGDFEGRILDPYATSGYSGESFIMADGDIIFTANHV